MSSAWTVTRITVIVIFLFPMKPPNGVAAVFFGYLSLQVQVTRIVSAMLELVVFCQILHPRFCLFLKVHRPRDRRDLQHVKMPILMHLSCVTPKHLVKHLQVQVSRNVLALVLRPFFFLPNTSPTLLPFFEGQYTSRHKVPLQDTKFI